MFNVTKFYRDYRIPSADSGSKHTRPGWINTHCPFCKGMDFHLGINVTTGAVKCWRCGNHSMVHVIKVLVGCDWDTALRIHEDYQSKVRASNRADSSEQGKTHATDCHWPLGTNDLTERGRNYLRWRGYDPDELARIWGLKETGEFGPYKFRIIAPITVDGKMVSYQGRDYTGLSGLKYKACEQVNEVIEHQTIVYGLDLVKGDKCIVVEGIADTWRLGPGAVCCFGTAFTMAQINMIAQKFQTVYILFDAEPLAQQQAKEMALLLSGLSVTVEILELEEGDPGEMSQDEADQLMEELGLWP